MSANAKNGSVYGNSLLTYLRNKSNRSNSLLSASRDNSLQIFEDSHQRNILYGSNASKNAKLESSMKKIEKNLSNTIIQFPQAKTDRKVTFAFQDGSNSLKKSFVELVNPIINRSIQLQPKKQKIRMSLLKKSQPLFQKTHTRRQIDDKVGILMQNLQFYLSYNCSLKQKAHCLFLQIKPLLNFIKENCNNDSILKKVSNVKEKFRTFQHAFKQKQVDNHQSLIQQFNQAVKEHIDTAQAHMKKEYELSQLRILEKMKSSHQEQLNLLISEKCTKQRQLQAARKKIQKLQDRTVKLQTNFNEKVQKLQLQKEQSLKRLQANLTKKQQQISQLTASIETLENTLKTLQKQNKSLRFEKQNIIRKVKEQHKNISNAKEQFLLKQIMLQKTQFSADLQQILKIQQFKYQEALAKIQCLKQQIFVLNNDIAELSTNNSKLRQQLLQSEKQRQYFYKKKQCLYTDLKRMNQVLYQHWLALKDIKLLVNQHSFDSRFTTIFQDLKFNDNMFQ